MKDLELHQLRVIEEKTALDDKLSKLTTFITSAPVFETLHILEKQRLREQQYHMVQYSDVLRRRIEAFNE